MYYVTVKASPRYKQVNFDDLFSDGFADTDYDKQIGSTSDTVTRMYNTLPESILRKTEVSRMTSHLLYFNSAKARLRALDRASLYKTFYNPKKDKGFHYFVKTLFKTQNRFVECNYSDVCRRVGEAVSPLLRQHETAEHDAIMDRVRSAIFAILSEVGFDTSAIDFGEALKSAWRRIDAPKDDLKNALTDLRKIFEEQFGALYHTSAFAYVHERSVIKCMKRHQQNESKWFGKFDLSNFFNSTTPDFLFNMLSKVYPFCVIVGSEIGAAALRTALDLCFLNGGLPQGTPISPLLTNVMMVPVDHVLCNTLRDFGHKHFVYTRYADDFIISCRTPFDIHKIERLLIDTLAKFEAPFTVNETKTRYGSSAGSNWNLGIMLNKDNNLTVGYENIRKFKTKLFQYMMDRNAGNYWSYDELKQLDGIWNYYSMVEGETIEKIVNFLQDKYGVKFRRMIREDLRRGA